MNNADRSAVDGEAVSSARDTYRHVDYLNGSGRGYVALCSKPGRDGREMDTRCYQGKSLFDRLPYLDVDREHFVSINAFVRPGRTTQNLLGLRACFIDLDCHRLPVWAGATPEAVLAEVRAALAAKSIPEPTLAVASGRGVHLYWRFPAGLPKAALPRWQTIQQHLVEKLGVFGADQNARDAARILRLAGTFNREAGKIARILHLDPDRSVSLDDLHRAVLPLSQHQLQELRQSRAQKPVNGTPPKASKGSTAARTFVDTMVADIGLIDFRWRGRIPESHRNTTLFVRGTFMVRRVGHHGIESALLDYGQRVCDLPTEEMAQIAGSIAKKLLGDGRGYRYSAVGAAIALGVTVDEVHAAGLARLHPPDPDLAEARRQARLQRNRERKTAKRRAAGIRPRSESLAQTQPWRALGMSERTWYRKGKPKPPE